MKRVATFAIVCICISFLFIPRSKNNVCKTFSDYYGNRDTNENCYYNPDTNLNVSEIIKRRGYPVEVHNVVTTDGYILTMFRIPYGKKTPQKLPGQPILIQHGVLNNCASFINRGNKSLAFILADAGYDVWLSNFRGTVYSKKHIHLKDVDKDFWEFTTHHLGAFDTSANVNLIFDITKQQIIYIGFSFGSTAGYMYNSIFPDEAKQKLKILISLAPTVLLSNWKSISKYFIPFWLQAQSLIVFLTNGEIYLRGSYQSAIRETLCLPYPFQMYMCQFLDMVVTGFDYEQNDPETLPITIMQNSDATSYRTISHGLQLILKGNFDYYDYGVEEQNKVVYGSSEVPQYNISKLNVPTYLIYAKNDLMITQEDVELLHKYLPKEVNPYDMYAVKSDSFNHDDFISARDVVPLVYEHLLDFINNL